MVIFFGELFDPLVCELDPSLPGLLRGNRARLPVARVDDGWALIRSSRSGWV